MYIQAIGIDGRNKPMSSSDSSRIAEAVTPHDTNNFTNGTSQRLWVGGAGNVTAIMNGATATFTGVPAGTMLPIQATRVNATGTTATNMVALFE